jgi:hypothetical protein
MTGDELSVGDDVLGASAPQAERVPRVVDNQLELRHDHMQGP